MLGMAKIYTGNENEFTLFSYHVIMQILPCTPNESLINCIELYVSKFIRIVLIRTITLENVNICKPIHYVLFDGGIENKTHFSYTILRTK